jgi:hypothetical protein
VPSRSTSLSMQHGVETDGLQCVSAGSRSRPDGIGARWLWRSKTSDVAETIRRTTAAVTMRRTAALHGVGKATEVRHFHFGWQVGDGTMRACLSP